MMQEEEIVMQDKFSKGINHYRNIGPDQDILPFTISNGTIDGSARKYRFTWFEMVVTIAVMLSTISGGFLEGYTSPAIPSLLAANLSHYGLWSNDSTPLIQPLGENLIPERGLELAHSMNSSNFINSSDTGVISKESQHFTNWSLPLNDANDTLAMPSPLPLSETFRVTEEEGSWLASLLLLGAAMGAAASPCLVGLGRRHAILASAAPRLLGWVLVAASSSVGTIYAGRFLCGFSVGAVSSATPVYISEVAHPSLRGSLACVVTLGVNVGIFVASFLGAFLDWRGLAVAGAVTVVVYGVAMALAPNSPAWLVVHGREEAARAVLHRLRGRDAPCVEEELQQIIALSQKTPSRIEGSGCFSWWDLLTERRTVRPLAAVLLVTAVNRLSGYNALISFCSLFIHAAAPSLSEHWATVAICLFQVAGTVGAMILVDSWGRRKLLLASVAGMAMSLVTIAACEAIVSARSGGTWMALLATMVYMVAYSAGIGPLTFVLLGELFPLDVRDHAGAFIVVANWLLAFVVTKTYFSLEASVGVSGTCLIYASVCIAGAVAMYATVPETKGQTLSQIEAHFSYSRGARDRLSHGPPDQALSGILDLDGTGLESYSTFA